MEATLRAQSSAPETISAKLIRRVRLLYRRSLADRADAVLAPGDDDEFARVWGEVSPHLAWNHRPSARRLWYLARLPMPGAIVEIGSYMGNSTVYLARAGGAVHAVDPHSPASMLQVPWDHGEAGSSQPEGRDPSLTFLANLERFGVRDRVVYHRATSVAAARAWSGEPIRLLYIDGLHTYDDVTADFRAWQPLLAERHVVLFDDFLWKEVEHAVRDLRRAFGPRHFYVRGGQAIFSTQALSVRVAGLP